MLGRDILQELDIIFNAGQKHISGKNLANQ